MTDPIDEVQALRRAARRLVRREDLDHRTKCVAIVELGQRADRSAWPWAASSAVWSEVRDFLGYPAPSLSNLLPEDPVEAACRALRREGRARCPSCRRVLPTDAELERWSILRAAAVDEARRKEAAVRA